MAQTKMDIFQQVEDFINRDQENEYEKVQLEAAAQIDINEDGHRTVYPGIHITVPGYDMPIFIAVGELRSLADASEEYIASLMNENNQTSKPKKTKG